MHRKKFTKLCKYNIIEKDSFELKLIITKGGNKMIRMTKNIKEANLITHNGKFHADEVMATAILSKIYDDAIVCRVDKLTEGVAEGVIVYNIDDGKFDLHLRNHRKLRSNGMPYSTCGLIWNAFGKEIVKNTSNPNLIWVNVVWEKIKYFTKGDKLFKIY